MKPSDIAFIAVIYYTAKVLCDIVTALFMAAWYVVVEIINIITETIREDYFDDKDT